MKNIESCRVLSTPAMLMCAAAVVLFCIPVIYGQGKEAGGGAGSYGKVYEASGKSAAARSVQATMAVSLQSAILRAQTSAAAKKQTKTTQSSTGARSGSARVSRSRPAPPPSTPTEPATEYTFFRPDPTVDTSSKLAETLGTTQQEKVLLKQLFSVTKTEFEKEVAKKGRQNNLAAAFTFFIGSAVMIYNDDPEPSDAALDNLWDGLNSVFDESPEFAALKNREKQEMYDTIVCFSGLILATYGEGKNNGNQETVRTARQLSGVLIQLVLKSDPNKLRFGKNGLVIKS
ncbi:MAG: DUF6683 family protein [Acidobacteriota bacterium]